MDYDLTKLHPDNRRVFEGLTPDAYISQEVIDKLYLVYVELNSIPKKDWGKTSTVNKIKEAQQEQDISVVE